MNNLIEITQDAFDIAKRIREIDYSYRIFYNKNKGRFELHGGKEQGFILALPFERLDARTEDYVRKTRIERLRQVFAELEEENAKAEQQALAQAKGLAKDSLKESADRVYYDAKHHKD